MNEKFFELTEEKQKTIINAAMSVFAENEYKKATTDDITKRASISKGLLFHYFDNKKGLYLYIYEKDVIRSAICINADAGAPLRGCYHAGTGQ